MNREIQILYLYDGYTAAKIGVKRIFETTENHKENKVYLRWHVMLCAHHCSKAVMFWQEEDDKEEMFKEEIMGYFEKYKKEDAGYIISSSHCTFTDGEGDNPPHKKARKCYEKIVKAGRFICTHEYPNKKNPRPIIFTIDSKGLGFDDKREKGQGPAVLSATVEAARGESQPPGVQTGFGVE